MHILKGLCIHSSLQSIEAGSCMTKKNKWVSLFMRIAFCIPFFAWANIPAAAQLSTNDYTISFLTTNNGLSQATNRYILEDSRGYVWLSSQDGVNRYNGKDFFHFDEARFFQNCPPIKNIFGILEDKNGNIWLGSRHGLYMYNYNKNVFIKFNLFEGTDNNDKITIPFAVSDTEVWVTDGMLGFKAIDCNTKKVRIIHLPARLVKPGYSENAIPQTDVKGNIWTVRSDTVYCIDGIKGAMHQYPLFTSSQERQKLFAVNSISLHNQSGTLGIAASAGFFLFNTNEHTVANITEKLSLLGQELSYIKADENGFLASNNQFLLCKINLEGRIDPLIERKVLNTDMYRNSATTCIYRDRWNRIWLNATGEYTAVIDLVPTFLKRVVKDKHNGLPLGTLHKIQAIGNNIWVSDGFLTIVDKQSGNIRKTFSPAAFPGNPEAVYEIFYDSLYQRLWVSAGSSLYYSDINNQRFIKAKYQVGGGGDHIRSFVRISKNELLLVCYDGIHCINKDADNGYTIPEFANLGIISANILPGKRLAVSSANKTLYIFQLGAKYQLIKSIDIGSMLLMSTYDTLKNVIWVAAEGGVYGIKDNSFQIIKHYSRADGMANDYVYAVIPDKYGWLWCSTNRGIVAVNTANTSVKNFGIHDNLQEWEFNNRAYATDAQGYIYFGGIKGLNYFIPPFASRDTISPKLIIENIKINDKPLDSLNPDHLQTLQYAFGATTLSIQVRAVHQLKAAGLKIVYRLKGIQENWIEINNGDDIQMFNLAPGSYTLELAYRDDNKTISALKKELQIVVTPPWYRTWWFLSICFTGTVLLIWLSISYREKQKLKELQQENELIKLKTQQEAMIADERRRITADLHDDVGATLSSMHIYGGLAENVWHTAPEASKEMVTKITQQSRDLMTRMGDIIWSMKPANEEKYTLEARLKNYCNELLSPKNITCYFSIDEKIATSITHPEARKNMLLIAKEAINNVSKYSVARRVYISLLQKENNIILSVTDDGKGFDTTTATYGNGLHNIQQRCKQLNGLANVTSGTDGTSVVCTFPIAIISHTM